MSISKFFDSEESEEQYLKAEKECRDAKRSEDESIWETVKIILKSFMPSHDGKS